MSSIGSLAYKVKFDANELSHGVMNSRKQMSAYRKILADSKSPLDRYADGLENLRMLTARFPDLLKHQSQLQRELERSYLQSTKAVRELTQAESARLAVVDPKYRQQQVDAEQKSKADRIAQERAFNQQRVALVRKGHEGVRAADQRRQKLERESVRHHREALHQKLADRQRHNEQMREKIRQSMKYHTDENKQFMMSGRGGKASSGGGMGGALLAGGMRAGGAIAAAVGIGSATMEVTQFTRASIRMAAEVERSAAAFEVFTGSAGAASQLMGNLRNLSARAGMSFDAMQSSAKSMMSFGLSAKDTVPALESIATITAGDPERFKQLSLAYSQSAAAGKLMGQELLQMVNAGFNPLVEISRTSGKSMSQLRKEMSEGKVTFDLLTGAFVSATTAGGKFNGMLEKMADTTSGAVAKSNAAWEVAMVDVGNALSPVTQTWNKFSTMVAEDISRQAKLFGGVTEEINEQAEAVDKLAKRQERLAAQRKKEQEIFAKQEKERQDLLKFSREQMAGIRSSTALDSLGDQSAAFNETLSLLKGSARKNAELDLFDMASGVADVDLDQFRRDYLSKDVVAELERTDALKEQTKIIEQQQEVIKKRNSFIEEGRELASGLDGNKLSRDLGRLMAFRSLGAINQSQFSQLQDKALTDSLSGQPKMGLATNATQGSAAAYAVIVGAQNVAANKELTEMRKQSKLQDASLSAQREQARLLSELNDKMPEMEIIG